MQHTLQSPKRPILVEPSDPVRGGSSAALERAVHLEEENRALRGQLAALAAAARQGAVVSPPRPAAARVAWVFVGIGVVFALLTALGCAVLAMRRPAVASASSEPAECRSARAARAENRPAAIVDSLDAACRAKTSEHASRASKALGAGLH